MQNWGKAEFLQVTTSDGAVVISLPYLLQSRLQQDAARTPSFTTSCRQSQKPVPAWDAAVQHPCLGNK